MQEVYFLQVPCPSLGFQKLCKLALQPEAASPSLILFGATSFFVLTQLFLQLTGQPVLGTDLTENKTVFIFVK